MINKPKYLSPGIYTIETDFTIYDPKYYKRKLKIGRIIDSLKHTTKKIIKHK